MPCSIEAHFWFGTFSDSLPKYAEKKSENEGRVCSAGAPTVFKGLGGTNRMGVAIAKRASSGLASMPIDITSPPLKGWPATRVGCAWSRQTLIDNLLTGNPLESTEP